MPLEDTAPASESDRIAACVGAVERYLTEQLGALGREARKSLIYKAHKAPDREQEGRFISMIEEVETLAPRAGSAFRKALMFRLKPPEEGALDAPSPEEGAGLTLVDTGKVDDWLRMREIVSRHSEESKALEVGLRQRLAAVAGGSWSPDSATLSVPAMCALFQSAMRNQNAGPEVRSAIYDAFEATVVSRLGALVAELYGILEGSDGAHGVTPAPGAGAGPDSSPVASGPAKPAATAMLEEPQTRLQATVHPERLLGAIAIVERQMSEVSSGSGLKALTELEARLATALMPPGTPLGDQEHRTMKAVAGLLHQAFAHPGIDPAVRARLWKLAPALALLALQDDQQLDLSLQATRHDSVTGLLDRAAFRVRLESVLAKAAHDQPGFAVCLVEVDGFEGIGRRLGPQVAGRLLRVLADLMRRVAGPAVQLARLRGADFGVLLPARTPDAGWRFANRYLLAVNKAHVGVGGRAMALTVSIGVVETDPSLTTAAEIMRAADRATASAREDGGGCARVHIPESFG